MSNIRVPPLRGGTQAWIANERRPTPWPNLKVIEMLRRGEVDAAYLQYIGGIRNNAPTIGTFRNYARAWERYDYFNPSLYNHEFEKALCHSCNEPAKHCLQVTENEVLAYRHELKGINLIIFEDRRELYSCHACYIKALPSKMREEQERRSAIPAEKWLEMYKKDFPLGGPLGPFDIWLIHERHETHDI